MSIEHWSSPNGCHEDCPACAAEETLHICNNCQEEWTSLDLDENGTLGVNKIPDLNQRVDPGGEVPTGECPSCGALTYGCDSKDEQNKEKLAQQLRNKRLHDLAEFAERIATGYYTASKSAKQRARQLLKESEVES